MSHYGSYFLAVCLFFTVVPEVLSLRPRNGLTTPRGLVIRQTSSGTTCQSDTIFLIDSSGSVRSVFPDQLEYVQHVVETLDIGADRDRVAVILFSGRSHNPVRHAFGDVQDKDHILTKISALPFLGGITAAGAALNRAYGELERRRDDPHTTVNVVIVSDAFSYDTVEKPTAVIRALPGARLFAVAIANASQSEMRLMAGGDENTFDGFNTYSDLAQRLRECSAGKQPIKNGTTKDGSSTAGRIQNSKESRTADEIKQIKESKKSSESKKGKESQIAAEQKEQSYKNGKNTEKPKKVEDTGKEKEIGAKEKKKNNIEKNAKSEPENSKNITAKISQDEEQKSNTIEVQQGPNGKTDNRSQTESKEKLEKETGHDKSTTIDMEASTSSPESVTSTLNPTEESSDSTTVNALSTVPSDRKPVTVINKVKSKRRPLDVVVLLDSSGSVKEQFRAQLDQIARLLDALSSLPLASHIGVVKFGGINRNRIIVPLNNSLTNAEIKNQLYSRLQFLGGVTYAKAALSSVVNELNSSPTSRNAIKAVVLFSDGFIQDEIDDELKSLYGTGANVFAAAITRGGVINRRILTAITGSEGNIYTEKNFNKLLDKLLELQKFS